MSPARKPSVLLLEASGNWGGVEAFLANVVAPLQDRFTIDVVAQRDAPDVLRRLAVPREHIVVVPERYGTAAYRRHMLDVFSRGYDIIHINKNSLIKFLPVLWAKRHTSSRVVVHAHNTRPYASTPLAGAHRLVRPFVVPRADGLLACSAAAARYMFGRGACDRARLVANGVDVERFRFNAARRAGLRRSLGVDERTDVVLGVGRLSAQKNPLFLVDAFARCLRADPTALLLIAGEGDLRGALERRIARPDVAGHVRLLGRRADVPDLYAAADLAVFPSRHEGLPIALVEAQAAGVPVLASDAITAETDLTGAVAFLGLDEGARTWGETMLRMLRARSADGTRGAGAALVRDAGYDMRHASRALHDVYRALLEE